MPLHSQSRAPLLPRIYGRTALRTLRAAIAVMRPRSGSFRSVHDEGVLMTALSFVPFLPPMIRYSLPLGLLYLEFGPVLYQYGMRRFTRMDDAAAERYMAALDRSHGPFQMAYQGIRSLVMLSFYQQPEVLDVLEVDLHARAGELIERRARLLRMAPELGNPKNARTNAERDARTDGARNARMSEGNSAPPGVIDGSGAEDTGDDDESSVGDAVS